MVPGFARTAIGVGAASFVAGVSIKALAELALGPSLHALDDEVLRTAASFRSGWLNGLAVDFTALGSGVLLVISTLVVGLLLLSTRDRVGAAHLALAALGGWLLTSVFKQWFARPRPGVVAHLVHVSQTGFSYPSGHALGTAAIYFSFALIARRHLPRHVTREVLIGFTLLMILLVACSRVYLGVHYASDVLAGVLIGVGWSLFLAGLFSHAERRWTGRASIPARMVLDRASSTRPPSVHGA